MADPPSVSVIIPVRDDAGRLALCLDHLARQTYPSARTEVLVVDNGSMDDVAAAVRNHLPGSRLLREPTPGSYAARNRAVAEARGDVLAFTDADCLPAPDWLQRGVERLSQDPAPGFVAGRVEVFPADAGRPTPAEAHEMAFGFPQEAYVRDLHFGATANLFVTARTMRRVGPFRADLRSGGDFEWGRRLHALGLPQVYEPSAVVRHPARRSMAELRRKSRRTAEGLLQQGQYDVAPGWRGLPWTLSTMARPRRLPDQLPPGVVRGPLFRAAWSLKAHRAWVKWRLRTAAVRRPARGAAVDASRPPARDEEAP